MENIKARPGYHFIFRPYFTDRSGIKRYAKDYGRKAWPIMVPDVEKESPEVDEPSVD